MEVKSPDASIRTGDALSYGGFCKFIIDDFLL